MRKNKKQFLAVICLGIFLMSVLTACDIKGFEMSEEDEGLVAEYAAGVISKYGSKYYGGLGTYVEAPKTVNEEVPVEEIVNKDGADSQVKNISEDELSDYSETEKTTEPEISEVTEIHSGSIADAVGLEDFEIKYSDYEITDVYPENSSNSMAFSMEAAEGKHLLILHLEVTNISAEDKLCDAINHDVKYRLIVNDGKRINEQMTILLDDLKSYSEMIGANETKNTVLVFEVDDETAENITSLKLAIVNYEGEQIFDCVS